MRRFISLLLAVALTVLGLMGWPSFLSVLCLAMAFLILMLEVRAL